MLYIYTGVFVSLHIYIYVHIYIRVFTQYKVYTSFLYLVCCFRLFYLTPLDFLAAVSKNFPVFPEFFEVQLHWDVVKEKNYELSRWNCQHFSKCPPPLWLGYKWRKKFFGWQWCFSHGRCVWMPFRQQELEINCMESAIEISMIFSPGFLLL